MDFFSAQEAAQKRSGRLVLLFSLAVVGTVASCCVAAVFIRSGLTGGKHSQGPLVWDLPLMAGTASGILLLIGLASLFKWSQLRAGGAAIAQMVGGRQVSPRTPDPKERRLLNIVEEMAIASGLPVPQVFVLDEEPGINAFAAGLTHADAVVAVTRGTLDRLNRDELQGVIAHEFSHILQGDMRLNVRLASLVFGILVLGLLGQGLLRTIGRVRVGKKNNGLAVIVVIGLALFIIGYIGYFFGRLIQAAVSRQREFLADAAAVQFTRNPEGIGSALTKIAATTEGSQLVANEAGQFSHFFFSEACSSFFPSLFATHPPLTERIRAIRPDWDGALPRMGEPLPVAEPTNAQLSGLAGTQGQVSTPSPAPGIRHPQEVIRSAGLLTSLHFARAGQVLGQIPESLRQAAEDPVQVGALVKALLSHQEQGETLLWQTLQALDREARLALIQLSSQGLKRLPQAQLETLIQECEVLIHADAQVTPFELCVVTMLRHLCIQLKEPSRTADYHSFQALAAEIQLVLSALAWTGTGDSTTANHALSVGTSQIPLLNGQLRLLPEGACGMAALLEAFEKLSRASLPIRKRTLSAAAHIIGADNELTPEELEMIRALSAAFDCPIPLGTA